MRFFLLGCLLLVTTACWRQVNLPEGAAAIQVRQAEIVRTSGADTASASLSISLNGEPRTLVSASSPIARRVEFHVSETGQDGRTRMSRVDSFDVTQQSPLILKHGEAHLMLIGVQEPLEAGKQVDLVLTFRNADGNRQDVLVEAVIRPAMQ